MMINDVLSVLPAVSFEIFLNRTEDTFYYRIRQAGGIRQEAWLVCVGEHQRSKLKNAREIRLTSFHSLPFIPSLLLPLFLHTTSNCTMYRIIIIF